MVAALLGKTQQKGDNIRNIRALLTKWELNISLLLNSTDNVTHASLYIYILFSENVCGQYSPRPFWKSVGKLHKPLRATLLFRKTKRESHLISYLPYWPV